TGRRRTKSSRAAAAISTWVTPSAISATWARICRVGRQGAQKAVENWTSVARWPSGPPRSVSVRTSAGRAAGAASTGTEGAGPDPAVRKRPARHRSPSPTAVATTRATASAINPPVTLVAAPSRPLPFPRKRREFGRAGRDFRSGRLGGEQDPVARGDLEGADRPGVDRHRARVPDPALVARRRPRRHLGAAPVRVHDPQVAGGAGRDAGHQDLERVA